MGAAEVVVDADGLVFVADTGNHRVQKLRLGASAVTILPDRGPIAVADVLS